MNTNKYPFEDIIKKHIAHTAEHYLTPDSSDKEAEFVFNYHYSFSLSDDKKEQLLSSLNESLSEDSLGTLIQKSLSGFSITNDELLEKTGMSVSLQQSILEDMVFPNSIPVKSLAKLLKYLSISIQKATKSIEKTYQILTLERKMFNFIPGEILPAFRQRYYSMEAYRDYNASEAKSSYLYQNREALDKYINRLEKLYLEV